MVEKYRHELKYICSESKLKLIENRIKYIMYPDPYANEKGEYLIRSAYFDDYYMSFFSDNENGTQPRSKYRIRTYNCSNQLIMLEKKIKTNGMTAKKTCRLDFETCIKMLKGESILDKWGTDRLLDEWIIANETKRLRVTMLGEYVRKPFVYQLGNVRITFDLNICASLDYGRLFDIDLCKLPILPSGYHVLEIKYDDYLPDIIYRLVDETHISQTTFSKFYLGCKALQGGLPNVI